MRAMTLRLPEDLAQRIHADAYRERVPVNRWMIYAALLRLDEKEAERETQESA